MIYHIDFAKCSINGAGCKGDLADSEIQVVVELCRNRYKMHLQEFMLNINPKTHRLMSIILIILTGPTSKLKNMSSSLPGIEFPNLALKEFYPRWCYSNKLLECFPYLGKGKHC